MEGDVKSTLRCYLKNYVYVIFHGTIKRWDDTTHRGSFVVRKINACAEFWTLSLSKKQKTPETNTPYIGMKNFHNDGGE